MRLLHLEAQDNCIRCICINPGHGTPTDTQMVSLPSLFPPRISNIHIIDPIYMQSYGLQWNLLLSVYRTALSLASK